MPYKKTKKNWQDLQKEKVILRREKREQSEKTLKSPESKPDLQVALALNEIFGTLLGETTTVTSKLDRIMRSLEWVEYDPMQCDSIRVAYQTNDNTIDTCRWVRYELNRNNPHALGTQGMIRPIYKQELHANPHPAPNFSEPHQFRNNALQVFHYNHGSCTLVDQALTQLGDIGLEGEVARYRFLIEEHDNLALRHQRINQEDLCHRLLSAIRCPGREWAKA